MKNSQITVAFTGGGTGGHIYPGLAVADSLRKLYSEKNIPVKIIWIGSSRGMDAKIVDSSQFNGIKTIDKFYGIPSGKLRRYFSLQNFFDIFKIFFGLVSAFFVLLSNRPKYLFSKGGFVSVPPCFAAKLLGIRVYTHECDYTPGLATRINSRFASKILLSYEETREYLSAPQKAISVVTGNPVRPVFYDADSYLGFKFLDMEKPEKPVLLVMGGSLGAAQINSLVWENLEWLCERYFVIHQTGEKNASSMPQIPDTDLIKNNYRPYPFIYSEMPHVIAASDVVLSRSGANSLWECAVLEKPMVLVPLCGSGTRGDQVDNAEFFARRGAAVVLLGSHANSNELKNALETLVSNQTRSLFAGACRELTKNQKPVEIIADILFTENEGEA